MRKTNEEWGRNRRVIGGVDIGDLCVHCRRDTAFSSGRFVNRYPVFGLYNEELKREEDGYCCDECEQQWYIDNPIGEEVSA